MNVTADISGIDVPKDFAKTRNLLKLVKIFSEGATLVHSLKNKKLIRKQVLDALEVFDKEFYSGSLNRRNKILKKFEHGKINEEAPNPSYTNMWLISDPIFFRIFLESISLSKILLMLL